MKPKLKVKKVKGRMKVLKVLSYKGSMIYIRQINTDIFMYDLVFKGEIYSSYLIITPRPGKHRLNKKEVQQSVALILGGAIATIHTLLGIKLDKEKEERAKRFLKVGEKSL